MLYHLEEPYGALKIIKNLLKPNGRLFIETHYSKLKPNKPIMEFYPGNSLNNDPSNFWGPNIQCLTSMLEELGFNIDNVFTNIHGRLICYSHLE